MAVCSVSVFQSCLSLFISSVCTCAPPTALSLNMSACLPSADWYAPLLSTLSLTLHMIVWFSHLSFLSHFPSVSCLMVAFFCILSFCSASVCVCCFSITTIPSLPSISLPSSVVVVIVVYCLQREPGRAEREELKERERGEQAPFSSCEPSKHLCLLFIPKMAEPVNNRQGDVRKESKERILPH